MIGYVKGKILNVSPDSVLIETAGGIGFEIICSYSAFSLLSGKSEGALYTYLQVSENGTALYGFSSQEEKNMFLKLKRAKLKLKFHPMIQNLLKKNYQNGVKIF